MVFCEIHHQVCFHVSSSLIALIPVVSSATNNGRCLCVCLLMWLLYEWILPMCESSSHKCPLSIHRLTFLLFIVSQLHHTYLFMQMNCCQYVSLFYTFTNASKFIMFKSFLISQTFLFYYNYNSSQINQKSALHINDWSCFFFWLNITQFTYICQQLCVSVLFMC